MERNEIFARIDHTLLKPTATEEEIYRLCDEALRYRTASVCIPPDYVAGVKSRYGDEITVCTVIGFPLGYNTTAVKVFETKQAIADGADEVDTVINIADVKNGNFDAVLAELKAVREACAGKVMKVIIETCFLTEEEKTALCGIVTESGADFIKTSTGFGTGGAALEDIELFKKHIGKNVKIKAAGGIRTREAIEKFIAAGCSRIGTSSAVKILAGEE